MVIQGFLPISQSFRWARTGAQTLITGLSMWHNRYVDRGVPGQFCSLHQVPILEEKLGETAREVMWLYSWLLALFCRSLAYKARASRAQGVAGPAR